MSKTEEMKKLKKNIDLIFENDGDITKTEKYRKNFLNNIVEQIMDKVKIADFIYLSGRGTDERCFDIIEVFFKIKSKNWPKWSTKEYVEKERKLDHDTFLEANLLDWLSTELEDILDADKVTVWIDVRSGDKKKRDCKIAIYHKRKEPDKNATIKDPYAEMWKRPTSSSSTNEPKAVLIAEQSELHLQSEKVDVLKKVAAELGVPVITEAQKNSINEVKAMTASEIAKACEEENKEDPLKEDVKNEI